MTRPFNKYPRRLRAVTWLCLLAGATAPCTPAIAANQSIGRLFFSPRERISLDLSRQANSKNHIESSAPEEDRLADQITLDGFIKKNNGKTTVWINQVPQHGLDNPRGITILQTSSNPPAISMQLPSGKNVKLKAGQTFDATNGKVTDVYEGVTKHGDKETAK